MASHSLAAAEMDTINTEVGMLASKIEKVEGEVAKVKGALQGGEPYLGISDLQQLLERLRALEKKEEQLRKEKEQLREKELRLLPAPSAPAASGFTDKEQQLQDVYEATCGKQGDVPTVRMSDVVSGTWEQLQKAARLTVRPMIGSPGEGKWSLE